MPIKSKTKQKVYSIPECSFCTNKAKYDGRTWNGTWAYMCPKHFKQRGVGLGLGKGQKLEFVLMKR